MFRWNELSLAGADGLRFRLWEADERPSWFHHGDTRNAGRLLHENMRLLYEAVVLRNDEAEIVRVAREMFEAANVETEGGLLLSLRKAAREVGCAERTLRVAVRNGELPSYGLGKRTKRVNRAELDQWVRSRRMRTWRDAKKA
jgi:excisionase family DNA binding protein